MSCNSRGTPAIEPLAASAVSSAQAKSSSMAWGRKCWEGRAPKVTIRNLLNFHNETICEGGEDIVKSSQHIGTSSVWMNLDSIMFEFEHVGAGASKPPMLCLSLASGFY